MAKLIRLKNQIVDLDAIQYAAYVPTDAHPPAPSSLHLIIGGVAVDLDQDDDADRLWDIITERLHVELIDGAVLPPPSGLNDNTSDDTVNGDPVPLPPELLR